MKDKTGFYSFRVNDLIRWHNRSWRVEGIYLGSENQQSLIGLRVDDGRWLGCTEGQVHKEMFVPEELLVAALSSEVGVEWFRKNQPEQSA